MWIVRLCRHCTTFVINIFNYYATASNTILLEGKPDTPEYVYVHNIEVNLLGDNTVDDYNHLGDMCKA
jgi:hypothetical protein